MAEAGKVTGKWFRLTQYFDYAENDPHGPEVLAKSLALRTDEVFPIHFDAEHHLHHKSEVLSGFFEIHPAWGVSGEEAVLMQG